MAEKKKTIFTPFVLGLLILILFTAVFVLLKPSSSYLTVNFFDVGQGDAALIITPEGQNVLIDGGPNSSIVSKLDEAIPFYDKRIDAIILSHPHADHLDGLIPVLNKFEVKEVYLTGVLHTTPEYIEFLQILKDRNIQTRKIVAGSELDLGNGIKIYNYYPSKNIAGQKVDNLNNSSIVSKLVWGNSEVLFTGDLEKEGQEELLRTQVDLRADVFKVPHHGSNDATSENFLNAVNPRFAVISVGKDNKFGHPSPATLDALRRFTVFRTDEDGDVSLNINQKEVSIAKN